MRPRETSPLPFRRPHVFNMKILKLNKNLKKFIVNSQVYGMECGVLRMRNMDLEKGRYRKTRGFRDEDMAYDGKNRLDGTQDK